MAAPLFIIYQRALLWLLFLYLRQVQTAGWLWGNKPTNRATSPQNRQPRIPAKGRTRNSRHHRNFTRKRKQQRNTRPIPHKTNPNRSQRRHIRHQSRKNIHSRPKTHRHKKPKINRQTNVNRNKTQHEPSLYIFLPRKKHRNPQSSLSL